jgi:hypothetical protein
MGASNAGSQIGDYVFSCLIDRHVVSFFGGLSAGATALMLVMLPLLPQTSLRHCNQ